MDWNLVIYAVAVMAGTGIIMGGLLAVAAVKFHVEVDPRVQGVRAALSGANCGACGWPGCDAAAQAIVDGKAPYSACTAGGHAAKEAIAAVLGIEAEKHEPVVTVVRCQGGRDKVKVLFQYDGVATCQAANLTTGGPSACRYGCLGYGDCAAACPFDALRMGPEGLPVVDLEKCTRCGICVRTCPRNIIAFLPASAKVAVLCVSHDKGKDTRAACSVGCIACAACVRACESKAITLVDNLAVIDYSSGCRACAKCVEKCPTKCFVWLAKAAETVPEPAA